MKPNNGSIQISGGKMRLCINGEWHNFGIAYVIADMKRIVKPINGRKSIYASIILKITKELDRYGLSAVKRSQDTLRQFWGCSEKWMAHNCRVWHGWLNQIYMFRNCTGKKDVPIQADANKAYRENMDKIFTKAA